MDEEIASLTGWTNRVFKPKGSDRTLLNIVLVAWDTEYKLPFLFPDPDDYEEKYGLAYPKQYETILSPKEAFLTHQFAVQTADETIVAEGVRVDRSMRRTEFVGMVHNFLDKHHVEWHGKRIVICSHTSRMELQHIQPLPRIKQYGGDSWEAWLAKSMVVVDTWKLFGGASLARVTETSPLAKVSLEGFRGESELHWRANPNLLFDADQEMFWRYALGDVKALLWALLSLRKFVWETWHMDLLRVHTLAGLSCRILQSRLREALEPAKREKYLDNNERTRTRLVFDPELVECRHAALRAYQGGRREAYVMGLVTGPVYCYDFSKQYTVATLSIPLPTQSTKIERVKSLQDLTQMICWLRVRFKFPDKTNPCIGVKDPRFPKLVFVREGECWTGVFSVRRALEKGAQIEVLDGWGFRPGDAERNHPIHDYFRELLEIGNAHQGAFLEYFAKNLANSLIGRLIGKYDLEEEGDDSVWKSSPKQVMASFAPMIACLVLDQARALEDRLIDLGSRHVYSHTDSIFCRDPIDLDNPLIQQIRALGGNVKLEMVAPYAWVLRSAVAYLPNPEPSGKPKAPRHAIHCRKDDYIKTVQIMLKHPDFKPVGFAEIRYTTLREHKLKRDPLASYKLHAMRAKYQWDYKRKLLTEPLTGRELWSRHIESAPWQSLDEIAENFKPPGQRRTLKESAHRLIGGVGRPSTIDPDAQRRIVELWGQGFQVGQIAKQLRLSKWAVYRFLAKFNVGGYPKIEIRQNTNTGV